VKSPDAALQKALAGQPRTPIGGLHAGTEVLFELERPCGTESVRPEQPGSRCTRIPFAGRNSESMAPPVESGGILRRPLTSPRGLRCAGRGRTGGDAGRPGVFSAAAIISCGQSLFKCSKSCLGGVCRAGTPDPRCGVAPNQAGSGDSVLNLMDNSHTDHCDPGRRALPGAAGFGRPASGSRRSGVAFVPHRRKTWRAVSSDPGDVARWLRSSADLGKCGSLAATFSRTPGR